MSHAATHAGAHPHPSAGTYIKIAIIIVLGLVVLMAYHFSFARSG